jgi:hypothetical protein
MFARVTGAGFRFAVCRIEGSNARAGPVTPGIRTNRATLAVARKLVAYLVAVEKERKLNLHVFFLNAQGGRGARPWYSGLLN